MLNLAVDKLCCISIPNINWFDVNVIKTDGVVIAIRTSSFSFPWYALVWGHFFFTFNYHFIQYIKKIIQDCMHHKGIHHLCICHWSPYVNCTSCNHATKSSFNKWKYAVVFTTIAYYFTLVVQKRWQARGIIKRDH